MQHDEEDTKEEATHFLDSPEVAEIFASVQEFLMESDRGAVLISSNQVDLNLRKFFEAIAPSGFGSKRLKGLLDYPGPLSTFASRENAAVLCGLIPLDLGESIRQLRSLRNKVAHSSASFRLRDHWDLIRKIYDLGPGVPSGINRMALDLLLKDAVTRITDIDDPANAGDKYFNTPAEALDYMKDNPTIVEPLEKNVPRMELCIGTAMICGLIVVHRERWISRIKEDV